MARKVNYQKIGSDIGKLVEGKQQAYGDSFGRASECLRQMFPDGIPVTKYDEVLIIARMLDKLFRIANLPEAFGENPYADLGGYSLLGYSRHQRKNNKCKPKKRKKSS